MTSRLPLAERRTQLVQAALQVAASEGIAATTVRRVAEQAGVALGVVHYCFASKDELFEAMATRIVEDLAAAGAAGIDSDLRVDLPTALSAGIAALWSSITDSPGEQLLTYEITTYALRQPGLRSVATSQYAVSHAAAEALLSLAASASGASWSRPVGELAGDALAFVDGITLRWLVDRDGDAARARLEALASYLCTQASPQASTESRRHATGRAS